MMFRIFPQSSPILSRSSIFRTDNRSSNSLIEDFPPTILLNVAVEIQNPSGTQIPSTWESSPKFAPLPPTRLRFDLLTSSRRNTNESVLVVFVIRCLQIDFCVAKILPEWSNPFRVENHLAG